MDPDRLHPNPPADAPAPLDDAAIAAAVRETADGWRMPPQRLGEPTWRDRVGRRSGGSRGGRGLVWTRRLIGAAAVAVIATVSLSFAAVWLTAPTANQGSTHPSAAVAPSASAAVAPSATAVPGPSGSAVPTPVAGSLPKLVVNGALPTPARVMLRTGGGYRLADLSTGTLGDPVIGSYNGPTTVLSRPGGGWVCICSDWTQTSAGQPNGLRLTVDAVDTTGASVDKHVLKELNGRYDPGVELALQPQLVDATVTASPDGREALIGWSRRDGSAGWQVGVDILDLETLQVVGSTAAPAGASDDRTRSAPKVSMSGDRLLLTGFWYVQAPNDPMPPSGTDHWVASVKPAGSTKLMPITTLVPAGSTSPGPCFEVDEGLSSSDAYFSACWDTIKMQMMVSRFGIDGTVIDTTALPQGDLANGMTVTTHTPDAFFVWNPFGAVLVRYDLATAAVTSASGRTASSSGPADILASIGRSLGRWLAPSAFAKFMLEPGIVASADGTRIYALGIGGQDGAGGSTGIYAFDAASLQRIGHWDPQADVASLAINADGTAIYAAAQGGVRADGTEAPGWGASVTVYDAADGTIRVTAGRLGTEDVWLTEPVLP